MKRLTLKAAALAALCLGAGSCRSLPPDTHAVDAQRLPAAYSRAAGGGSDSVSGGAGYVTQPSAGLSGSSNFSLTASQEARTVTIAIAPYPSQ